jgi:choline dehydrogenase
VLAAGAVNTPMLQLSGVGPADLLKSCGIAVHHEAAWRRADHLPSFRLSASAKRNDDLYGWAGRMLAD